MSMFKICPCCRNQVVLNAQSCRRCSYCFCAQAATVPAFIATAVKQETLWQRVKGCLNGHHGQ
jgi:hypothetical protein